MRWRSLTAAIVVFVAGGCVASADADQDPANQPSVTVLGTSVGTGQPQPTIGSAVSTER